MATKPWFFKVKDSAFICIHSRCIMKKSIAFFDFDGTITTKDTMLELIKFMHGIPRFYKGLAKLSPYLVALKLGIIKNDFAKEKMLAYFFRNTSNKDFTESCRKFSEDKLPQLIRPGAMERIRQLQQENTEIVIVSASAGEWIKDWCDSNGFKFLATSLESKEDKLTGKLLGKNCHGEEKVVRIKQSYDLAAYDQIYAFGDTTGDKPMLALAQFSYYKPFR